MLENIGGQSEMDNLEKLAIQGTQDEEKQTHITIVLDTTIRKQTQIMLLRHEPSHKQLDVKTKRTSFLFGNRNG